ncbi:hypothetical protein ACFQ1S_07680 [Kibdelosporangium lantanae]|uniref:Alpha/beta hydrolase n=1 Tax=Kibdelosporangium lantanae TaxID=1497396 RepID=A0ABW3M465_9PSEU
MASVLTGRGVRAVVAVLCATLALPGVPVGAATATEAATPQLTWTDCEDGFQCATAEAPLDYDRPAGAKVELAVIKLPAPDPAKKIGTLFVNFGGPGGSG